MLNSERISGGNMVAHLIRLRRFQILKTYRTLQILNLLYNTACKRLTPLMIFFIFGCHIAQPVTIIRGYKNIPVHFTFALIVDCLYFFKCEKTWFHGAGRLYDASEYLKRRLLGSRARGIRRIGRACRPLRLQVGSFYVVRNSTLVIFFSIMSNYTVMLLLYRY